MYIPNKLKCELILIDT